MFYYLAKISFLHFHEDKFWQVFLTFPSSPPAQGGDVGGYFSCDSSAMVFVQAL